MAHGGAWTDEHQLYLVVMKLATRYSWRAIAALFQVRFNSAATSKDCESKFNKDLKKTKMFKVLNNFFANGEVPEEGKDEERRFLAIGLLLLGETAEEMRRR
ncbi:hypothetical protein TSTA_072930 [Talaromyces stipitatus ATCC 10500]|uniref:Myb-like domain-containing protein n=1 Tax=Talaromyces stipitatus (strain ATCC 10500 / CBS 375.48 / QM 6759 / NRRL 1006) TaxID=441959 RepID=B8LUP6_TALSN|nr:uncharacterized protein TSTA_072930 [Talaromyces stipitatus ATCC 10500]EED23903.1 hypothetical protein TSTA_072930 [Talaromyces stipitatus ATCC 10500]